MKTNRQIRMESLKRTLTGKWFGRMLAVMTLLGFVSDTANRVLGGMYKSWGIQTWFDFIYSWAIAVREGLEYTVPSRAVLMQMNNSTAFSLFIAFIFGGIALFGTTAVVLKAAKEDDRNWFRDSFAGFARPLGLAWLGFVLFIRVALWSLVLLVPGIVASYRYSQCWNLKVEHPDWSAGRCLAESSRIMNGYKWQRFRLDVCFVIVISAIMFFMYVTSFMAHGQGLIAFIASFATMALAMVAVFVGMWMSVARAIFYKALPVVEHGGNLV